MPSSRGPILFQGSARARERARRRVCRRVGACACAHCVDCVRVRALCAAELCARRGRAMPLPRMTERRSPTSSTDDALAGPFRVWQRRRGHRYSLDDVATAWVAAQARPARALRARSRLRPRLGAAHAGVQAAARALWGIEAQAESFALCAAQLRAQRRRRARVARARRPARRRARSSACAPRSRALGGDGCELVTGTPPYQPRGPGHASRPTRSARTRASSCAAASRRISRRRRACSRRPASSVVCADARRPSACCSACGSGPGSRSCSAWTSCRRRTSARCSRCSRCARARTRRRRSLARSARFRRARRAAARARRRRWRCGSSSICRCPSTKRRARARARAAARQEP